MDESSLELQMFSHSIKLRGIMLEATVEVERKMDYFLSNYFCRDIGLGNELLEMLWCTERITISSKKDILFLIINRHYKQFVIDNPKFIGTFDALIPHRNIFAHLEIDRDVSDYDGTYEIKFKKYNKGKIELRKYGKKEVDQLQADFDFVNQCFDLLIISKAP